MSAVGRRAYLIGSFAFSQLLILLILRMPTVPGEGSWLQAFRGYFSYDQLSYAAITSTTAAGVSGLPEPFTETGHSYYPSLWYRVLGWLSALTGWSTPAVWTIAGYLLLAAAVALIGYVGYRISGLVWAPALVGPALLVGTLSVVLHDNWYTTLESHAVLWGPYGAIYVLNAEVAGFACVGAALAMALRASVSAHGLTRRAQALWLGVAAALLGITANLQTYIFFVGAAVAFAWLAAYGLLRSRSRPLVIATAVLVVATFALGGVLAGRIGALPVYGLLIACTLPGIWWTVRTSWRTLLIPAIVFALTAMPQALIVASGIARHDPFLAYRQDVSSDLGVPLWAGLIASLPIGLVWVGNVIAQRRQPNPVILAALAGTGFAGVMLTFNNAWGFGQEPYRMWIDSVAITALLLAPITAWNIVYRHRAANTREAPQGEKWLRVAVVGALVVFALSLLDFGSYRTYVANSGVIRFDTARDRALSTVTSTVDGLLTTGPCLDPQEVKIATRKPIAYYNLGIAWPEDKAQIDAVLDAYRAGSFAPEAMRAAHIRYLVTDTSCPTQWPVDSAMGFLSVTSTDYSDEMGSGKLTLWRIL